MSIFKGIVSKGAGYGRTIGFPTVNITQGNPVEIKHGVYSGKAILDGKEYRAGIVVGPEERIEAHLIGYDGDAYGKEVEIIVEKFLREFKEFGTEEELKAQIAKDLESCK